MKDDTEGVWAKRFGRFLLGRADALDEGWTHKGRLIVCRITANRNGMALLFRIRSYWLFWSEP